MSQNRDLCRSGCGFYGSLGTDGLCSQCYNDALKRNQAAGLGNPTASASSNESASSTAITGVSDSALNTASPAVPVVASTSQDATVNEKAELNLEACGSTFKFAGSLTPKTGSHGDQKDQKKKQNRCGMCRKKVGLTSFECRCGDLFCSLHRYSDEHDCTFDYKELGAQEIRKNNPGFRHQIM